MTLGDALERVRAGADGLVDALSAVRVTVCEDLPGGTPALAVDELVDAIVELAGEAEALRDRVRQLSGSPGRPARREVEQLVAMTQGTLNDITDGLADRVLACERLTELERTTRRGGASWRSWWLATSRGLADCGPAVRRLRDELFTCWRELIENATATGRMAISPSDTNP
jgi:hypothetical protein